METMSSKITVRDFAQQKQFPESCIINELNCVGVPAHDGSYELSREELSLLERRLQESTSLQVKLYTMLGRTPPPVEQSADPLPEAQDAEKAAVAVAIAAQQSKTETSSTVQDEEKEQKRSWNVRALLERLVTNRFLNIITHYHLPVGLVVTVCAYLLRTGYFSVVTKIPAVIKHGKNHKPIIVEQARTILTQPMSVDWMHMPVEVFGFCVFVTYFVLLWLIVLGEQTGFMVRYFAWRQSLRYPLRPILWLLDRPFCLFLNGPFQGCKFLLIAGWRILLVSFMLFVWIPLQCVFAYFPLWILAFIATYFFSDLMAWPWIILLFGYACFALFKLACVALPLLIYASAPLAGPFNGNGAVSAINYSAVIAALGVGSLLSSEAWKGIDWHAPGVQDSLYASGFMDSGLVGQQSGFMPSGNVFEGMINPASGLPMMDGGIDVAGNVFGANSDPFGGFGGGAGMD